MKIGKKKDDYYPCESETGKQYRLIPIYHAEKRNVFWYIFDEPIDREMWLETASDQPFNSWFEAAKYVDKLEEEECKLKTAENAESSALGLYETWAKKAGVI